MYVHIALLSMAPTRDAIWPTVVSYIDGAAARPRAWRHPDDVLAQVDECVEIPMIGAGASLNVAVAGSLVPTGSRGFPERRDPRSRPHHQVVRHQDVHCEVCSLSAREHAVKAEHADQGSSSTVSGAIGPSARPPAGAAAAGSRHPPTRPAASPAMTTTQPAAGHWTGDKPNPRTMPTYAS